ncbi:MAG: SPOR domain-containing protein [Candidatus Margulisbacteria bacterium]|nr:SPOR domain-containing protein [Candidatus Margulisiibacteriota bacterium]MBU1021466.1 SPOR domain-containing protein [Candidatus Margulisiibacteriota bacterium]MBU1728387.1 SPOR domain-containing protein [Candidatus Margulisiibacteriota bacterium]MBU1955870.1 SPOR domain-containing protein [Candidatus Margulisiibacteriota bacterium]
MAEPENQNNPQNNVDEEEVLKELGFTSDSQKSVGESLERQKGFNVFKLIKSAAVAVVLLFIIVASFWVSYTIGKNLIGSYRTADKAAVNAEDSARNEELDRLAEAILTESKKMENGGVVVGEEVVEEEVEVAAETPAKEDHAAEAATLAEAKAEVETAATATTSGKQYYKIIAGTYVDTAKAQDNARALQKAGFQTFIRKVPSGDYRVQIGAFYKKSQADTLAASANGKGFDAKIILE